MEITYKNGAPTIRLVKHVKRGNFPMVLYGIANNLLQREIDCTGLTVMSMHATCMQRGFHMHHITCTYINQNTFK